MREWNLQEKKPQGPAFIRDTKLWPEQNLTAGQPVALLMDSEPGGREVADRGSMELLYLASSSCWAWSLPEDLMGPQDTKSCGIKKH